MEESRWLKPINLREFYVLSVLCIIAVGVSLYDWSTLMETKQQCLNDCNNHWVKEFEDKCMGLYGQKEDSYISIPNYSIPNNNLPIK